MLPRGRIENKKFFNMIPFRGLFVKIPIMHAYKIFLYFAFCILPFAFSPLFPPFCQKILPVN